MKNLKIKIKPFEVFADQTDREQIIEAIMEHLSEISEEAFFTFTDADEDEDDTYPDEDELM
jgi:hypothetical protein